MVQEVQKPARRDFHHLQFFHRSAGKNPMGMNMMMFPASKKIPQ